MEGAFQIPTAQTTFADSCRSGLADSEGLARELTRERDATRHPDMMPRRSPGPRTLSTGGRALKGHTRASVCHISTHPRNLESICAKWRAGGGAICHGST